MPRRRATVSSEYIAVVCIVMAYIVMVHIVMYTHVPDAQTRGGGSLRVHSCCLYSYGLHSDGSYSMYSMCTHVPDAQARATVPSELFPYLCADMCLDMCLDMGMNICMDMCIGI